MTVEKLRERMAGRRVLVVGDLMLDEYLFCNGRRVCAEGPGPLVKMRERRYHPGGAANVAATILRLGGKVLLGGVIGADQNGEMLDDKGVGSRTR